jgi:hypothetical protein
MDHPGDDDAVVAPVAADEEAVDAKRRTMK